LCAKIKKKPLEFQRFHGGGHGTSQICAADLPFCASSFSRLEPLPARESTGLSRDGRALAGSRPMP